ncbi:MAG: prephenate dehydratase [Geodermatophilaceae bacterium]|jgi:prephenate dehydratase|nr:prephenate dehydratase [Geodermatophilaceae bacterium]
MPGVPPTRFAFLGPEGTFAEEALRTLPATPGASEPAGQALPSVSDVLDAVRRGEADAGLVPLENSIEGSVAATVDELATGDPLVIVREVFVPVTFPLLVRAGTSAEAIRTFATHPHAYAQVRRQLKSIMPDVEVIATASTAAAAEGVAQGRYDSAVASPLAAARYRLTVVRDDVADHEGAVTRFVLVSRPAPPPPRTGNDKTSVAAFIDDDHTGALLEVLTEFSIRGISLTRIESRPTKQRLGIYFFSLDCEGHVADDRVGEALTALRRLCADLRFLGSYPRADGRSPKSVPERADDAAFADATAWLARLRGGRL